MSHVPIRRAIAVALCLWASSLLAHQPDRYAYILQITPEARKLDPAIDRRFTAAFKSCQSKGVSTIDYESCFGDEFARQDAELNRAWDAATARLPLHRNPDLLAAQQKWMLARDPFCSHASDEFRGGTIAPIIYSSCRVELTIRRTIWLEGLHP